MAGCGVAFHVAADYRLWVRDSREMFRSNVDGTRNVLEAASRAGVERIVYTSTVGCIGFIKNGLGDETTRATLADMAGPYKRSKFQAEQVALEYARKGLPVVIVNPTAPVGEHDVKPTPTGQTIVDFLRGAMPAYLDTGLNIVDARETAEGHWLACERGRAGERYILGSENLTLREIFETLARISGRPAPRQRIPWIVAWMAGVISTGLAEVTAGSRGCRWRRCRWRGRRCGYRTPRRSASWDSGRRRRQWRWVRRRSGFRVMATAELTVDVVAVAAEARELPDCGGALRSARRWRAGRSGRRGWRRRAGCAGCLPPTAREAGWRDSRRRRRSGRRARRLW